METAKKNIGALFGLSEIETDILIEDIKQKALPALTLIARILFVVSFLYCFAVYTAVGFVLLVLAYYVIQLERKIESLERKLRDSNDSQQWFF